MPPPLRFVDAVVVIGILISVILADALAVATTSEEQIAFIVGLAGTIIALQVDIMMRLARRSDHEQRKVQFLAAILEAPSFSATFAGIADAITSISGGQKHPAFTRIAKQALEECLDQLHALQGGVALLKVGDSTLMIEQVRTVTRSIHATTFPRVDVEWWGSSAGQVYLKENERALQRGVTIERVFVYDRWTDEVERLAAAQHKMGIQIYRVDSARVAPELCQNIAIYDRKFLAEDITNASGDVTEHLHTVDEWRVNRAYEVFCRLLTLSTPYEPSIGELPPPAHDR